MLHAAVRTLCILSVITSLGFGQATTKIWHIEVGQGSATLVQGPTGQTCLIDAGSFGMGNNAVVPLLNQLGITHLDYTVLTHWHTDHWGGFPEVRSSGITVGTAYDRGTGNITSNVNGYFSSLGNVRATLLPGMTIDLGGGASLRCICADGVIDGGGSVNVTNGNQIENARSIGLRLTYGNYHQSVCGDLTGGGSGTPDVESVAAPRMGDVDVMVLNHHGSFTSSNATWISVLDPEVSVCSCGNSNPFGHPHSSVVNRINNHPGTVQWYRLNQGSSNQGGVTVGATLKIETDGQTYTASGGSVSPITWTVDEGGGPPVGPTLPYVPGDVVVSEYMNNPFAVDDADGEWVELFNTTAAPINLAGFVMRDQGSDLVNLPAMSIPARGRFVVARNGNSALNGGVTADWDWPSGAFALANGDDEIEIVDPTGQVLDQVIYDNGVSMPDPTGASVERIDVSAQPLFFNFAVATTAFGAGDLGTPGAANSVDQTGPFVPLLLSGPLTPGTPATLSINAGIGLQNRTYVMGLSECPEPGLLLPGTGRTVDLCQTALFTYVLTFPDSSVTTGFQGTTNLFGFASATLNLPAIPQLVGQVFYASAVIFDAGSPEGVGAITDNAVIQIQ